MWAADDESLDDIVASDGKVGTEDHILSRAHQTAPTSCPARPRLKQRVYLRHHLRRAIPPTVERCAEPHKAGCSFGLESRSVAPQHHTTHRQLRDKPVYGPRRILQKLRCSHILQLEGPGVA